MVSPLLLFKRRSERQHFPSSCTTDVTRSINTSPTLGDFFSSETVPSSPRSRLNLSVHLPTNMYSSMFVSNTMTGKQPLRSGFTCAARLLSHHRTQSTLAAQKPYWNHIQPWQDVTKEEFISYRWQVCSIQKSPDDTHTLVLKSLTFLASQHHLRQTQAFPIPQHRFARQTLALAA
jgi:hypothetical protein